MVAARRRRQDRARRSRCGRPTPATAARSRAWWPTTSCIGRPAIGWCSRGKRDGWLLLYSVPASGGKRHAADPGQFRSRVREHRARSDADGLQLEPGRHRSTPRLDGAGRWIGAARPQAAVNSIGSEWQPVITSDGHTAAMHADAQMPPHVFVIWPDGHAHSLLENMLPAGFDPAALVAPAGRDHQRNRWHAHSDAAVPAERSESRREAAGADLFPRRIAAADAARRGTTTTTTATRMR